ncbi:DUF4333 domain-containing protein [Blastococcus sp. MG754426]|uniref:DUF4333 domain-containing protein n=1 Tax=Blastococcus sp. MG754426 TaxID=2570317 RepID=UPI001F2FEE64|nr:DUF4333 domain-containing protein [Blastococcus sp. MG754426]MCF6508849.1 DUF4333 domain-containing protein [Blastococcus sp. MG754426]MCF6512314.1 DUF4333 domain-containing protein [Blastococcus sp. MG754427]
MTQPPYGDRPQEGPGPSGPPAYGPPRAPQRPGWSPHGGSPPQSTRPVPYPAPAPHGVPGYGPPGYGPPAPRSSGSRRRAGLLLLLAAVALALVAGVALLAATTGPTVLSRSAVERDVAEQFQQREGVAVDLDCEQEMHVEPGATYECTGVTADEEQVTLRIEITDADGARYTWSEP